MTPEEGKEKKHRDEQRRARLSENDARLDPAFLEAERQRLEDTWRNPRGLVGWLSSVDHKSIGRRFLVTAFVYFTLGGILAALMRIQLARPENTFLGPDLYNQVFTIHGTTMMFLFAVPVVLAMGVYFVPLMIGARGMALPRLLAYGYWMFLFGGIFLYVMFLGNVGPDNGWFSYPPLAGPEFGIGKRADVWAQLITFSEVSSLVVATCLITTILKLRTPGMSLNRMPLFVWSMLVISVMILFAMPAIMTSSTCLILDRLVSTHFYNHAEGGDSLLWQHLFWFFGHPEVYIIFLPALGMMSEVIGTFARRPVFGYLAMVLSMVATAFIGFGVWVHHMFTTGLPQFGQSFFTAASIMIVIPTAVQLFGWIATIWTARRLHLTTAVPVHGVVFLHFRDRRALGGDAGVGAARPPGPRYLLHRRALSLRADRRVHVSAARRDRLLVPENDRPDDERAARQTWLLVVVCRLQHHLLSDAPARPGRHAPAGLHLPRRARLAEHEPARDGRRRADVRRAGRLPGERVRQPAAR